MIRLATPSDIPQCLELARRMHSESRYRRAPFNDAKVSRLLNLALTDNNHVLLVAERDGVILGGILGFVVEDFFGDRVKAGEYVVFIAPEYRGGTTAFRLINQFEKWAKWMGAQEIDLGITTGVHTEQTAALYGKLGYDLTGVIMTKEI